MATWHQQQADKRNPGAIFDNATGFWVLSDGYSQMRSVMNFGEDEAAAKKYLENVRQKVTDRSHYLYHGNRMVG